MFLRKIFATDNKFVWVLIDLIIVIIGVYCAFLIQSYAEKKKTDREKEKIFSGLKYELEIFRFSGSEISAGVKQNIVQWEQKIAEEKYHDFSGGRFIEPQYSYQIIELSININNSDIIDFEFYEALQNLYVEIKKVEHSERLLTEVAMRYHLIPESIDQNSKEVVLMRYENFNNFRRYVRFTKDRGNIMTRIVEASQRALDLINQRLSPGKRKAIEENLIRNKMQDFPNEKIALQIARQFFPNWTEEEILELHREVHPMQQKTKSDTTTIQ